MHYYHLFTRCTFGEEKEHVYYGLTTIQKKAHLKKHYCAKKQRG
jgi:hypothetical protein